MKRDILLLADAFEKFILIPGLSWDAILKMTGVALEGEAELAILTKDIAKHLKISIFSIMTRIIYMDVL